jgi:hypothetical protein
MPFSCEAVLEYSFLENGILPCLSLKYNLLPHAARNSPSGSYPPPLGGECGPELKEEIHFRFLKMISVIIKAPFLYIRTAKRDGGRVSS